ncbi:MAG: NAD(+)/NADH kinase [Candidatus Thermoplasmatota archaeon]|nr:NAD(+)/NADH kinase [Candidatus Thermoplasmatota archaeon]
MNILVVFKKNFEEVHDEGLMSLKAILQNVAKSEHHVDYKPREHVRRADFIARDLVIVFGGDGTLTSLSHNIDAATPVMGVNSHPRTDDPEGSYGFYMDSSISTFEEDVQAVFAGSAIVNELPRLQALIETTSGNRFTTDPAMNDLLIANTHQYAPSKYHLRRGEQQTHQQSSGLLFSTWFGQGAWLRNAMGHEEFEQLKHRAATERTPRHHFVYARDLSPEQRSAADWAWMEWTDQETTITSDMHRGFVVPDGWDEVHFNRGATITVNADAPKLTLLTFRTTIEAKLESAFLS